jgi:hypothetical protein
MVFLEELMKNINVGLSGLSFELRTSQMIQKERKIYRTQEMTKIISAMKR